jgi:hypothetical protein
MQDACSANTSLMVTRLTLCAELADVIDESRRLVEQSRRVRGVVTSQEPGPLETGKPKRLNRPFAPARLVNLWQSPAPGDSIRSTAL